MIYGNRKMKLEIDAQFVGNLIRGHTSLLSLAQNRTHRNGVQNLLFFLPAA